MPLTMTAGREAHIRNWLDKGAFALDMCSDLLAELDAERAAHQETQATDGLKIAELLTQVEGLLKEREETQAKLDANITEYHDIRHALREGLTEKENLENACTLEKIRFTQTKLAETQAITRELLEALIYIDAFPSATNAHLRAQELIAKAKGVLPAASDS